MEFADRVAAENLIGLVDQVRETAHRFHDDHRAVINELSGIDDAFERIEALLDAAVTVIAAADPVLVSQGVIDGLRTVLLQLQAALGAMEPYGPDGTNASMVQEVVRLSDALADQLGAWPFVQPGDWREAATQAATTYRRSLGQQVGSLQSELDQLRAARVELGSELERESTDRLTSLRNEFASYSDRLSVIEATATRLQESQATTEAQLERSIARSDQALAAMQSQFSEAQEERTKEAARTREKLVEDTNNLLTLQEQTADSLLHAIREHVDSAANLVSVFAAAGTANAYSKEAKQQADAANNWRLIAIGLGIVAGVAAGAVLVGASSGDAAWQLVIGKLAIGVVFGGLASYAASQSARHRRREEGARHLELNLATFGPLAEELGGEALATARAELVGAMLRREDSRSDQSSDAIGENQINLLQRLVDLVVKQR